jgi:hypothetical protein
MHSFLVVHQFIHDRNVHATDFEILSKDIT